MNEDNELPVGWIETTLESIARIRDDLRVPINADERSRRNGAYPYYGATGQVGWIDSYLMDGEYVLLGEDGAPFLDQFKQKAYLVSGKCWVNNHAHVLQAIEGLSDNRFLIYALNFVDYREVVNGTTRLKLTQSAMRQIPIKFPPFPEQHRIVAAIEQQFTRLDAGVAALKQAQKKLKLYRSAVLKAAVEGELTEDWRGKHPATEPATMLLKRILQERRAKWEADQLTKMAAKGVVPRDNKWKEAYKEPAMPDIEGLPKLPEGWCWATVEQCIEVHVGATPSRKHPEYWNGNIPWVSSGEVQFCRIHSTREHITNTGLLNSSTQINPRGTVLLGMIGEGRTRGQAAILDIDACNNQNCAAIWVSRTPIAPEYVFYWFWSQYEITRRVGSGNSQHAINKLHIERMVFPLQPLAEQEQIVTMVEEQLSIISVLETTVEHSLKRVERERQSILREAFAGRLVSQDPQDEPASVLLERIREERERREEVGRGAKKQRGKQGNQVKKSKQPLQRVLLESN